MRELVLIRHGETPWNAEELFRDQEDVTLSRRGWAVLAGFNDTGFLDKVIADGNDF